MDKRFGYPAEFFVHSSSEKAIRVFTERLHAIKKMSVGVVGVIDNFFDILKW